MNNLKKFSTEADYSAATLNYPAVSWVTGTDTVHFDKSAPVVNNKVKIAFTTDACGAEKTFNLIDSSYVSETLAILNGVTVNGEPFTPGTSAYYITLEANTDYLIEYELKDDATDVENFFGQNPIVGCSSTFIKYDILFPAQVGNINFLNDYGVNNLILESETPPTRSFASDELNITAIYVPDSAVNTYKNGTWSPWANIIYPISEYSGDIPVE